jgi:hypothetical protein
MCSRTGRPRHGHTFLADPNRTRGRTRTSHYVAFVRCVRLPATPKPDIISVVRIVRVVRHGVFAWV